MARKHATPGRRGPAARPAAPLQADRRPQDPGATEQASIFDLELTAPVQGGKMLARLDGQVTFVTGGVPGEEVEAFIPVRKRGYLEGEARAVRRRSPDRVAPPCPYFGENGRQRGSIEQPGDQVEAVCGGCQYQHIGYQRQIALKGDVVRDVLRRVGKILEPPVAEPVPSPNTYAYRNKASWLVTAEGELAYRAARSHTAVPIRSCDLLEPGVHVILRTVQRAAHEIGLGGLATGLEARVLPDDAGNEHGTLLLELAPATSEAEAHALAEALIEICPLVVGVAGMRGHEAEPISLAGEPHLQTMFLGELLTVSATSFFQVNLPVATEIAR
ncbi:MAG TPA: hypothetical protein VHB98_20850, partial [Chloroflexota bacterium]|nr:hypothetical protein [Chloroflexota bacterium]